MLHVILAVTMLAGAGDYGIDWRDGVVRVPAGGLRNPDTHALDQDALAAALWQAMKDLRVSGEERLDDVFASEKEFTAALRGVPAYLVDDTVEVPLDGPAGLVARIREPTAFSEDLRLRRSQAPPEDGDQ